MSFFLVCFSHCHWTDCPPWLSGCQRLQSRVWRQSTIAWKIPQTTACRTLSTLAWQGAVSGHWVHREQGSLQLESWSDPRTGTGIHFTCSLVVFGYFSVVPEYTFLIGRDYRRNRREVEEKRLYIPYRLICFFFLCQGRGPY